MHWPISNVLLKILYQELIKLPTYVAITITVHILTLHYSSLMRKIRNKFNDA